LWHAGDTAILVLLRPRALALAALGGNKSAETNTSTNDIAIFPSFVSPPLTVPLVLPLPLLLLLLLLTLLLLLADGAAHERVRRPCPLQGRQHFLQRQPLGHWLELSLGVEVKVDSLCGVKGGEVLISC
jgi:hypothetical protein